VPDPVTEGRVCIVVGIARGGRLEGGSLPLSGRTVRSNGLRSVVYLGLLSMNRFYLLDGNGTRMI